MEARKLIGVDTSYRDKIRLDKIFLKKFLELPPRQSDLVSLLAMVDFDLPDSAEDLGVFLDSDKGAFYRLGFKTIVDRLAAWVKANVAVRSVVVDKVLATFANQYLNYKGNDAGLNVTYFPTYRQAIPYLIGVNELLDNPAVPLDVRQKHGLEILRAFLKCFPGLFTRVFDAYTEMMGFLRVSEDFLAYRSQVASNVAVELIRQLPSFDLTVHPGDEIHYVNRLMQEYASELGILVNEDTLNRGDEKALSMLRSWYPNAVSRALNLSTFLQFLISKLQLDETCKRASAALSEGEIPVYNDLMHDLKQSVNRYGEGEVKLTDFFVLADDCLSLKGLSFKASAYMHTLLIDRLIDSHVIDKHSFVFKRYQHKDGTHDFDVRYIEYGSLLLASVKLSGQSPISFLQYYLQSIIDGKSVDDLDKLILKKNGNYYREISSYMLAYLHQRDNDDDYVKVSGEETDKILRPELTRVIKALAQASSQDYESVLNRIPDELDIRYCMQLLSLQFPNDPYGNLDVEIIYLFGYLTKEQRSLLVKAFMGEQVNLLQGINDSGDTLFHLVCEHGSGDIIHELLPTLSSIRRGNSDGVTPLMHACASKNPSTVRALLAIRPGCARDKDNAGLTPLHYACKDGTPEIVADLLGRRPDLEATSAGGFTPMQLACYEGNLITISLLIGAGADINATHAEDGTSILDIAAIRKNIDMIYILFNHHAEINTHSRNFGDLFNLLCCERIGPFSLRVLTAAIDQYIHDCDISMKSGKYSKLDITKTADQNFRMFREKTSRRYAKSRVAGMILKRLTERDADHALPLCQSKEEREMFELALQSSKKLRSFFNVYNKINAAGYLGSYKRQKSRRSTANCLPGFGSP